MDAPIGLARNVLAESPAATWANLPDACDVLVIGAGPAGAVAALLVARQSLSTLLVEKSPWPRRKVCGGCLNPAALTGLARIGLDEVCDRLQAREIHELELRCGAKRVSLPLPVGRAIERRDFDAMLVDRAVGAGAKFVAETRATVLPMSADSPQERQVELTGPDQVPRRVSARLVLVADGLGHPSLAGLPGFEPRIRPNSRIGLGAFVRGASSLECPGAIMMTVGRGGYLGMVETEQGINLAAAIDRSVLKARGAAGAVGELLRSAGLRSNLATATWSGTRPLSWSPARTAAHRLFVVGDAAGYVEPFTGQGMAVAIESAIALAPWAMRAHESWDDRLAVAWEDYQDRLVRRQQRICRALAAVLRRVEVTSALVALLRVCPQLAAPWVRRVSCPRPDAEKHACHT